jgi:hypothetical protein
MPWAPFSWGVRAFWLVALACDFEREREKKWLPGSMLELFVVESVAV